jgi:hypothetical protein
MEEFIDDEQGKKILAKWHEFIRRFDG